ncbi:MAG: hypothetical protein CM15mV5_0100 [uncultured marine virus]|nr:MAG: hypothetical protein CM15mV5_0100 [uncultured marine virus]
MSKPLNRDELNELKSFLAERIVDNMSTKDLEEYVLDDLFTYYDKMGEHEFIDEAKNYWDDMYDEAVDQSRVYASSR